MPFFMPTFKNIFHKGNLALRVRLNSLFLITYLICASWPLPSIYPACRSGAEIPILGAEDHLAATFLSGLYAHIP